MNDMPLPQTPSRLSPDAARPFIIVADDEKRIADTLALILESKGYTAQAAYDGTSALELCRQSIPDLLVSDVMMPGMNGIELAIAVRQEFPACQILLFSGQAATAIFLEDAVRRGYDFEILAKPVHPEDLLARVRDLVGPGDSHSAARVRAS